MSKVTYEFQIRKYKILRIEPFTEHSYTKIKINGKCFDVIPTYDMPNCVSIQVDKECSFLSQNVEFIL